MKHKVITVALLLITATILLVINFINDWFLIAVGLLFAFTSLLFASILLFARHRNEKLAKIEK